MNKILLSFSLVFFALLVNPAYAKEPNQCIEKMYDHVFDDYLNLQNCNLTDSDVPAVLTYLENNPEITQLSLASNRIGSRGAEILAKNTTIKELDISANRLGDAGAKALAKNTTLEVLRIYVNGLYTEAFIALAENNTLKALGIGDYGKLSGDIITSKVIVALARNKTLTDLYIYLHMHREYVVDNVALEALSNNKTLTTFGCVACKLDSSSMPYLAKMPALTRVDVFGNHIGDKGAIELSKNTNLEVILAGHNDIRDKGANALATLPNLLALDLSHSRISPENLIAIANNKSIRYLALYYVKLNDDVAKALAKMTLKFLGITNNGNISAEGIKALKESETIEELYISDEKRTNNASSPTAHANNSAELKQVPAQAFPARGLMSYR